MKFSLISIEDPRIMMIMMMFIMITTVESFIVTSSSSTRVGGGGWQQRSSRRSSVSGGGSCSCSCLGSSSSSSSSSSDPAATTGNMQTSIEYQSDSLNFGRGDRHLSAVLEDGDTVVYRAGYWFVDGVRVGDEEDYQYRLCRISGLQVVWTHNCEHGVLRGFAVEDITATATATTSNHATENETENDTIAATARTIPATEKGRNTTLLSLRQPLVDVEFGPEQLIAKINNIVWQRPKRTNQEEKFDDVDEDDDTLQNEEHDSDDNDDKEEGLCSILFDTSLWEANDAMVD